MDREGSIQGLMYACTRELCTRVMPFRGLTGCGG